MKINSICVLVALTAGTASCTQQRPTNCYELYVEGKYTEALFDVRAKIYNEKGIYSIDTLYLSRDMVYGKYAAAIYVIRQAAKMDNVSLNDPFVIDSGVLYNNLTADSSQWLAARDPLVRAGVLEWENTDAAAHPNTVALLKQLCEPNL